MAGIISFLAKGGPLVIPIIFCSLLSIALICERFYRFHKARLKDPKFIEGIQKMLKQNEHEKKILASIHCDIRCRLVCFRFTCVAASHAGYPARHTACCEQVGCASK